MNTFEENMKRHNIGLSPYACKDEDAKRFHEEDEDMRSPFFRDIDRIIYTYAYIRYSDKTQVYSKKENDLITKRMVHVQYVSKIARTIGRALGLNEDLIEAASLGHDLGHVPFGHFGESVLNEISLKVGEGYFYHNVESVRLLMEIEGKGMGKNLTVQVLDAILCHNGEFVLGKYYPKKKTLHDFLEEYHKTYTEKDFVRQLVPMTLEGCVVRISDVIAYLGKDIDDACMLGVLKKEEIPESITSVLGNHNREIVNTIVMDIIQNSLGKPYIQLSENVYHAVVELKKFNYEHIYNQSLSQEEKEIIRQDFSLIYQKLQNDLETKQVHSEIFVHFLNHKSERYLNNTSSARKILDFIAGMTDDYFLYIANSVRKNF